ncbi:MAG: protein phosphatase 2C domain-containing protein [Bacteroidales bacterium]|jgi:serine/threonine protein phosphatase PrpC|nr:protein phosphatase 2C domain-containing protein [Bacteroidales bacterium]
MDWNSVLQEIGTDDAQKRADFMLQYEDRIKASVQTLWDEFAKSDDEKEENLPEERLPEENLPEETPETSEAPAPEDNDEPVAPAAATAENNSNEKNMIAGTGLPDDEARERAKQEAFETQIRGKHIAFPNGKVNHAYEVSFDLETQLPDISEVEFAGLEQIGLQYDAAKAQITGIPTQAGDHKIEMKCKRKDWTEGKPLIQKEITLFINPDPKSLWKNIPSEQDAAKIEYPKPDSDKGFVKVASKKTKGVWGFGKKDIARKDMVAASQRGRSHALEGKPRDDEFGLYFDEQSEWYVLTVADGAGSAKYSRRGSQIACRTVIDVCKAKMAETGKIFEQQIAEFQRDRSDENRKKTGDTLYGIIGTAAFQAKIEIEKEAAQKDSQGKIKTVKDFSTTLLISVCRKFEFGWFVGAFWVGDGGIGLYRKEPPFLKILGEPDGGEFAGQTRFITMQEVMQPTEIYRRLRFDIVDDFTALILMTDGITDPKFETDANLNKIEKWHALWDDLNGANEDNAKVDFADDNEQTADQLLQWLDFWSKGNHDDRTIAILF